MGRGGRGRRRGGGNGICGLKQQPAAPDDPNAWSTELFDCTSSPASVFDACCCNLCTIGYLSTAVFNFKKLDSTTGEEPDEPTACSGPACYALVMDVYPCPYPGVGSSVTSLTLRSYVRQRFRIGESEATMCWRGCCCPQLSNAQLVRELRARGMHPLAGCCLTKPLGPGEVPLPMPSEMGAACSSEVTSPANVHPITGEALLARPLGDDEAPAEYLNESPKAPLPPPPAIHGAVRGDVARIHKSMAEMEMHQSGAVDFSSGAGAPAIPIGSLGSPPHATNDTYGNVEPFSPTTFPVVAPSTFDDANANGPGSPVSGFVQMKDVMPNA